MNSAVEMLFSFICEFLKTTFLSFVVCACFKYIMDISFVSQFKYVLDQGSSVSGSLFNLIKSSFSHAQGSDAVGAQAEKMKLKNTIWYFIVSGNINDATKLIDTDPSIMRQRGEVQELPIHVCFLVGQDAQLQIFDYMVSKDPELLFAEYGTGVYEGENVLHIAIVRRRFDLVKKLMAYPNSNRLLQSRAVGKFFKIGQPCYYGEFPLAFAICTNQYEMFEYLMEIEGATPTIDSLMDSQGNNICHMLAMRNEPDTYKYFKHKYLEKFSRRRSGSLLAPEVACTPDYPWDRKNENKLTPLTLCATLGHKEMFDHFLEASKEVQWSYGPVTCVLYPLHELEDLEYREDGKKDDGALEIIINNAHHTLLANEHIRTLVERKWNSFAKNVLFRRICVVFVYLLLLSAFTIHRQYMRKKSASITESGHTSFPLFDFDRIIFYGLFLVVVAGAAYKGYREAMEIKSSGMVSYFSATGSAFLENFLSLSYSVSIFVFTVMHLGIFPFVCGAEWEGAVLGLASILCWSYSFFFMLAYEITGPMVIMVKKMLLGDIIRFCIIYLVFIFGFAQAFFILDDQNHGVYGFINMIKICFEASLGDFSYSKEGISSMSNVLLVVYIVVVSVLLLNMLIAMMSDTYNDVKENAESEWMLERARIVFAIENEMTVQERKDMKNKYFVESEDDENPGKKKRYLMVEVEDKNHFSVKKEKQQEQEEQFSPTASTSRQPASSSSSTPLVLPTGPSLKLPIHPMAYGLFIRSPQLCLHTRISPHPLLSCIYTTPDTAVAAANEDFNVACAAAATTTTGDVGTADTVVESLFDRFPPSLAQEAWDILHTPQKVARGEELDSLLDSLGVLEGRDLARCSLQEIRGVSATLKKVPQRRFVELFGLRPEF